MTDQPLASIIISSYNYARYLPAAIECAHAGRSTISMSMPEALGCPSVCRCRWWRTISSIRDAAPGTATPIIRSGHGLMRGLVASGTIRIIARLSDRRGGRLQPTSKPTKRDRKLAWRTLREAA
jgi:hypothetical protein